MMSQFVEYTEPVWRRINMRALHVNEAVLILNWFYKNATFLYFLSEECYKCPYTKLQTLPEVAENASKIGLMKVNVARSSQYKLFNWDVGNYAFANSTPLCDIDTRTKDMLQFGVYNLTVYENGTCVYAIDKEGVNVYLPFLPILLLLALALSIMTLVYSAWQKRLYKRGPSTPTSVNVSAPASTSTSAAMLTKDAIPQRRVRSLDTFRGLAIVFMIFVNSGGGAYWWISHSPWNGLHVADVVFPSFLWIMGACIPISVRSQLSRGVTKKRICLKIVWRSLKLFAIGLCLNTTHGPQLERVRIMGILQKTGITFLICGLWHTIFMKDPQPLMPQVKWKRAFYELFIFKTELAFMFCLTVVHQILTFYLPVPGCPTGYLGPGGKHDNVAHPHCIGGAARYIDLLILGLDHMSPYSSVRHIYNSGVFEYENLLSILPTSVHVFFGVLGGIILQQNASWRVRIRKWLSWSVLLALMGAMLCELSIEEGFIPINKRLWSLSFVLVVSALCFLIMSLMHLLVDVLQNWNGFPLNAAGKNSILMYIGHSIITKMLPWHWKYGAMNTHFVLLLESIWNSLLWVIIAIYLDCKQFYYSL